MSTFALGHTKKLPGTPFDKAYECVLEAMKAQGFGALTEIDVRDTLAKKLGVDFRPYTIIGGCHPPSALRVLESRADAGLLLPCNIVVESDGDGGSIVSAINARAMFQLLDEPDLEAVANDVDDRLQAVLDAI